ncbi:MAG: efflux RND transporter periplasmic adaptor subunit [Gemmataceae bacterium]|nr:efflux RND transporter periplasmic adaptor subunit [Gemmataceae bacterium]
MNANVDLSQLAVRRESGTSGSPPRSPARRRQLLTRYVVPGAVLLGFLGILAWSARGSLLPARAVTVTPVLTSRAEIQQAGTPLFQAAGWVEPRPVPSLVTALAEGVVEQLLVVEGQEVKAGDALARLLDTDARLILCTAEADLRLREAELASARANLKAAQTRVADPVQLQAAHADANALLAKAEAELANLPYQLRVTEARQRLAKQDLDGKTAVVHAVAGHVINQAQSEMDVATALVEEFKARKASLEQQAEALRNKRDVLRRQLELKTEELRQLGETEANVQAAEARLSHARTGVDVARLRLERMTIRAPQGGRVLSLVARPGTRVVGLTSGTMQDSSTIITLYDPQSLQVRADVPFDQVTRVLPGQPARIETDAVPGGVLEGEVLFKTAQADMQKNTLQVKVAVKSPPADLKPDMLVRLTFLAPPNPAAKAEKTEHLRMLVPRQLVENGEGGTRVWLADQAAGVARSRTVKLGQASSGDWIEVVEGLAETDKLIASGREGLQDGARITVTGEDATGVAPAGAGSGAGTKKVKRMLPGEASPKAK